MAVSFIGQAAAAATSVTLPAGISAGDIIIIFAYRNATTAPTLPAGYTNITTASGNSNSYRVGYKIATGSDTSGTWTNANVLQAVVYRGASGIGNFNDATKASNASATMPAISPLADTSGNSWVVGFAGSRQTTSQGTPSGMTSRGTQAGTTSDTIAADTNGGVSTFAAHTSANGTAAVSGGISVELLADLPMSSLVDPFNITSLNTSLWSQFTAGSATMSYSSAGASSNMPSAATSASDADITSNRGYDLTGSYAILEVTQVFSGSTNADATLQLIQNNGNDILAWQVEAGTLYAQKLVAGSQTNVFSVTYSSSTHKYWRIREAAGTTYWDTSPDGVTWTNRHSETNPVAVTNMYVNIAGTCYENETSPGSFVWSNFNNIFTTTTKTQTGKSRITITTPKTLTGKSRIKTTTTKTQLGKSRLTAKTTKTQTGLSRISIVTPKTLAGKSRITAATDRTQLGHSRIAGTTSQTIQGKASIVYPFAVLQDYFNQNALDTSKWGEFTSGGGTTAYDATGASFELPASSTSSSDSNISSNNRFSLVGSYAFAQILEIPSPTTNADGIFKLQLDANNALTWIVEAGVLYAQTNIAGTLHDIFSVTYNPAVHVYWRIRESGGTVFWDTSPDSISWTNQTSAVAPFNVSSLLAIIGAACYENETNPGAFKVNDFNIGETAATKTITGKSRITAQSSKTQSGKSRITVTTPKTQSGRARITATDDKTQPGRARITAISVKTIPGKSRITVTTLRSQTGRGRITAQSTKTQTGKASIKVPVVHTQTGRSRITVTTDRTQTGKARITVKTTRNITGKGRITAKSTKTQAGKSRITATDQRTMLGRAAIKGTTSRTQLGRARITGTASHTQQGKSRIMILTPRTVTGRSRITRTSAQVQAGRSRITVITSRVIEGVARLQVSAQQSLEGLSRITAITAQNMLGKARIISAPIIVTKPVQLGVDDTGMYVGTNDTGVELGTADESVFPGADDTKVQLGVDDTDVYGSP